MRRHLPYGARSRSTPIAELRKLRWAHSDSDPGISWIHRSFGSYGRRGCKLFFRLFLRRNIGRLAAARHGCTRGVDAPLALDVVLCFLQQRCSQLGIAAREHGVASLAVSIVLEPDGRRLGIELEGVLARFAQCR